MYISNNFSTAFQGGKTKLIERTVISKLKDDSIAITTGEFNKNLGAFTKMESLVFDKNNGTIICGGGISVSKGISRNESKTFTDKVQDLEDAIVAIKTINRYV